MLDNGHKKCPYTDEIVSYMYDEIGGADYGKFESHLAACSVCTDEFALIANARFSVYEWHKEEFAHLPTPQFVIPYNAKPEPAVGFFAGLRELLAFGNWPVTAAAALALVIGAFFAMSYFGSNDQQTIADVAPAETITPAKPEPAVAVTPPANDVTAATPRNVAVSKATEKRTVRQERKVNAQRVMAEAQAKKPATPKAPVLAETDDDADTTLRLTDLFDGIGG
jgi:hypothetical protein